MAWKTLECDNIPDAAAMSILIVKFKGTVSFTLNCDATKYIFNKGFSFYEVMHDNEENKIGLKFLKQPSEHCRKINFIKNTVSENSNNRISCGFSKEWKSLCNILNIPSFEKSIKYELKLEDNDLFVFNCSSPISKK